MMNKPKTQLGRLLIVITHILAYLGPKFAHDIPRSFLIKTADVALPAFL